MCHCLDRWIFQQFEESLSTDQHKLTLQEPLVKEDCDLLKQLYLPCAEASTMLDLTSLSKEDVQSYGIVFNALDSKNTGFIN